MYSRSAHYAAKTEWGKPLVSSPFTLGLMIGMSVNDTTFGTTLANRSDDQPRPGRPIYGAVRARPQFCLFAARAAGVVPIDAVFTDFRDSEGLTLETDAARRDGFSAKAAIHPAQIDIINQRFSPTMPSAAGRNAYLPRSPAAVQAWCRLTAS
jgi:citrate lyase beta subunit